MEHSVTLLSSSLGQGEANRVGHQPYHVDADADAEVKANKQRRKLQNRKNQRAHRLRIKEQVPGSSHASRPFHVRRWRLDEPDDCSSRAVLPASKGASAFTTERACVLRGPQPASTVHSQQPLTPPSVVFPLSTDHLLHLVQYNVFRAFVSNKRTLNTLLTGWTDKPSSPTTCPISGPYRDDTSVYPLNPNIPPCLVPTRLQQTRLHSLYINLFPFPCFRDNLIRREGSFDQWELLQDLIGELMSMTPARERRGIPIAITVSDPKPKPKWTLPLTAGRDEDEITAGRKGLIVWGEPHDIRSWEATPGFLEKWSWAVEGCDELVEASNRWRLKRGEEPMRLCGSRR
ncbi:hypothetical protein CH063_01675 [Colletotrichum higginsianum]|uniref:BZIP domain-containing protein n=1 Tax=Colletotrichum higginsianum (strain IMI 349063) TaxID=759273 RepID=H1VAR6_COLHI|nr:hypothetical protein CH63R_13132 [Colletotrichum higginsianum IMI 349063]OBR04005.1 hypothetical protein CH63R_13132 [Colletotrichum higginsianum IMI 349063]CCF37319.1 hypothetical protein CH063_01675 [Colletotrichum higginsianum]